MVSWGPPLRPNGFILEYTCTIILLQLNAVAGFADVQTVSMELYIYGGIYKSRIWLVNLLQMICTLIIFLHLVEAGIPYSLTAFAVNTAGSGERTSITNFTEELQ